MKSILMSIKPKWIEKIASGEKTVEVRKSVPKCGTPFKVYMYCTKEGKTFIHGGIQEKQVLYKNPKSGNIRFDYPFELFGLAFGNDDILSGKVVGEFVCDKICDMFLFGIGLGVVFDGRLVAPDEFCRMTCLTEQEICDYVGIGEGYGLHISELKIYDKPRELIEFNTLCKMPKEVNCENCHFYNWNETKCVGRKVTRPPQSWQFVEEVKI